jgi:hypothetical protein
MVYGANFLYYLLKALFEIIILIIDLKVICPILKYTPKFRGKNT